MPESLEIDIIEGLRRDHAHIAELIALAQTQIHRLATGQNADYDLLEDIMIYVTGRTDADHHPTEDVIFDRLRARAPDAASDIDSLAREHDSLIADGRRFLEALRAVEDDAFVQRDAIAEQGRAYMASLGAHMDAEETQVFRLAEKVLTERDWQALGERLREVPDPLFGASLDAESRRLWQRIQAHRSS